MYNLDEYERFLKLVRYQGRQAGYNGVSELNCPYKSNKELRDLWLDEHTIGKQQRLEAFQDGSHHDLPSTRDFSIPTGTRRGRKPGTP